MVKRKSQFAALNSSDSNSSSDSDNSDLDNELLKLGKKNNNKKQKIDAQYSDSAESQNSDDELSNNVSSSDESMKSNNGDGVCERNNDNGDHKRGNSSSSNEDDGTASRSRDKSGDDYANKNNSELEEGEVTDDSDSSLSDNEEFNDGYDSDMMGDDEDRERLGKMTEKEREQEIFKRVENREMLKARFDIEKKLRQAKKHEVKRNKRADNCNNSDVDKKSDNMPLDLKERVLERKKTAEENRGKDGNKFAAMNMLKEKREQKREREEKERKKIEKEKKKDEGDKNDDHSSDESLSSRRRKTKLKASDIYSDDSGSSSDDERSPSISKSKNKKRTTSSSASSESGSGSSSSSDSDSEEERPKKVQYISTRDELNKMRLSRYKLERFVHLPTFKKTAVGCFVRIMIGQNNNKPVYRCCEIIDVCETAKVYQLGNTRTNKGLRLKFGIQERVWRLEFMSNAEFSENEFNRWQETCVNQGVALPTIDQLGNKVKDIQEALAYEFKEEDVEKIVKEKDRFKKHIYNYAAKKTQLIKERDEAQCMGDNVRANELQEELNVLEKRASELDRLRTQTISSISYINDRNRKKNVEEAEKAIIAEVRANRGKKIDDPFTRRHTKPCMVIVKKSQVDNSAPTIPLPSHNSTGTVNGEASTSVIQIPEKKNNKENKSTANRPKSASDLYSAHDFDIKIDINNISSDDMVSHKTINSERPTSTVKPVVETNNLPQSSKAKRTMNVDDYKRRFKKL